ncbi:branched-chain amino acid ABC transporter permease [bacterium]|nr:branched-chain amino acid ABC transporter permease [bacterium]
MGIKNYISLLIFLAVLIGLPLYLGTDSYWLSIFIIMGIYSLITIGLSLLMGYAGQISLGHGAFFGLGAYISGLLCMHLQWNPWITIVTAMLITAGVAFLIGMPCLRLSGHYLAMATLAFGEIVVITFTADITDFVDFELTGGPAGFAGIPLLSIGSYELASDFSYYCFVWGIVFVVLIFVLNMIHSRVGRALRSIHGGELAANAMGVNTTYYKVQVFVLSAVLASLAGSLYAHYVTFVSPTACELKFSVMLVVMVAVGGMANVWGAILGTVLLVALPEYLAVFEDMDILVYGLILVCIMIFMPGGLFGTIAHGVNRCLGWFHGKREGA